MVTAARMLAWLSGAVLVVSCSLFGPIVECPDSAEVSHIECDRALEVARAELPLAQAATVRIEVADGCPEWSRKHCLPPLKDGNLSVGFFATHDSPDQPWFAVLISRQDWLIVGSTPLPGSH